MLKVRLVILTAITMTAFAGNSLLCRAALRETGIDAASFTTARLLSGALMLWVLSRLFCSDRSGRGNWVSAIALFAYAVCFSFAYLSLSAGTGALLLFGAVQTTMIGHGFRAGERLRRLQLVGLILALGGLIGLVLPGLSAPPLMGALLMLAAGVAWGVYSLRGRGAGQPICVTAGNFMRSVPFALILTMLTIKKASPNASGLGYAIASGAVASGIGYAIWYMVLPSLRSATAATVQLSVPVIAAVAGIVFLGETMTLRLAVASGAILSGIGLVIVEKHLSVPNARH